MLVQARLLLDQQRFDDARQLLESLVAEDPCSDRAWPLLAIAYSRLGRLSEARQAAERATQVAPARAASWHALGQVQEQQRQLQDAEAAYRRAIEVSPGFHQAYQRLGILLQQQWLRDPESTAAAPPDVASSDIHAREQRFNNATRICWDLFAPHRRRVTDLLLDQPAEQRGSLSVLGAGNCNDVDLSALCSAYADVHLVDLDALALANGIASQGLASGRGPLHLYGGVDVTGIAERLDRWTATHALDEAQLRDCVVAARESRVDLPGPVDVAVSVCLLSQLMEILNATLGSQHPVFARLAAAVRSRHVELLVDSVRPGGRAVIVTDVSSSDIVPELIFASQRQLPALLERIMRHGHFLSGVNPHHLWRLCHELPSLARRVAAVRLSHPWVWYFPGRTYVVCALEIRRTRGSQ